MPDWHFFEHARLQEEYQHQNTDLLHGTEDINPNEPAKETCGTNNRQANAGTKVEMADAGFIGAHRELIKSIGLMMFIFFFLGFISLANVRELALAVGCVFFMLISICMIKIDLIFPPKDE